MEQVNHPKHYNARPDKLECIDIIRHYVFDIGCAIKYLWRDGLKQEEGMTDREKTIEDLEKAIWYINDELYLGVECDGFSTMKRLDYSDLQEMLEPVVGMMFVDIANDEYYGEHIARAMFCLLHVGLIKDGVVYRAKLAVALLREAIREIQARIKELKNE